MENRKTTAARIDVPKWTKRNREDLSVAYQTKRGTSLIGRSEEVLGSTAGKALAGRVQLVFTSPPFPLNRKKKYDNLQGDRFRDWLSGYANLLADLLTPDGSIAIEMGNAWEPGVPIMSTLALESLLAFKKAAGLFLCQEFVWHNPAKLPTPAQWVTIERIRVKDSFTRIWWLSRTEKPKADNRRVLAPYSDSMRGLLRRRKYNAGRRPSQHVIGQTSFLTDNGGAIPPSVIRAAHEEVPESVIVGSNTGIDRAYQDYCARNGLDPHPARMPSDLARFFINLCTEPGDLVLDPFGGSNTTGAAAEELHRQWLTVEANPAYAASGQARFGEVQGKRKTGHR